MSNVFDNSWEPKVSVSVSVEVLCLCHIHFCFHVYAQKLLFVMLTYVKCLLLILGTC